MSRVQDRVSRAAPWQQSSNHTFSHAPVNWAENRLLWKTDHTPDPTGLPGFRQLPFGDKPLTQAEPLLIAHLGGSSAAGAWYQRTEHEDYKRLFAESPVSRTVGLDVQCLMQQKHAASHLCAAALQSPFSCPALLTHQGSLEVLDLIFISSAMLNSQLDASSCPERARG